MPPQGHWCRAHILEQEAKAKATKKKATNPKKKLLKVQEALRRVYRGIEHLHSKCVTHIFEKIEFKAEMKKLSKKISQVTWDVAIQAAHLWS